MPSRIYTDIGSVPGAWRDPSIAIAASDAISTYGSYDPATHGPGSSLPSNASGSVGVYVSAGTQSRYDELQSEGSRISRGLANGTVSRAEVEAYNAAAKEFANRNPVPPRGGRPVGSSGRGNNRPLSSFSYPANARVVHAPVDPANARFARLTAEYKTNSKPDAQGYRRVSYLDPAEGSFNNDYTQAGPWLKVHAGNIMKLFPKVADHSAGVGKWDGLYLSPASATRSAEVCFSLSDSPTLNRKYRIQATVNGVAATSRTTVDGSFTVSKLKPNDIVEITLVDRHTNAKLPLVQIKASEIRPHQFGPADADYSLGLYRRPSEHYPIDTPGEPSLPGLVTQLPKP